jgi:murein DD-endopeptidase MepM/ murein hydrolase activator NlpD
MVFGVAKPRIYVPSGVDIEKLEYVIKHEKVHLRRGDTFFKLMAFAILSFYWMNPLAWIAFKLFNLDMELSCDEAVLQKETVSVKEAYGKWLVFFASKGSVFGPVPTSFGETDVEKRVKNMKNIKAVKGGIAVVASLIVIGATVLFLVKAPKLFKTPEKEVPGTGTEETLTTEVKETAPVSEETEIDAGEINAEDPPTLKSISEQYGVSEEDLTSLELEITLPNNERKTIPYSLTNVDQNEITINGETYKIEMVAWVWPLDESKGVITATFGERPSLTDEEGENTTKTHEEVDIAAEEGTPVLAARMGEITFAGWEEDTGCGNVVIIKADASTEIKYSHLKSVSVKEGDKVLPGDQIGEVGNTGYSTGPHLGFQIKKDGVSIDPMTFYEQE